jgi:hypothetical protein
LEAGGGSKKLFDRRVHAVRSGTGRPCVSTRLVNLLLRPQGSRLHRERRSRNEWPSDLRRPSQLPPARRKLPTTQLADHNAQRPARDSNEVPCSAIYPRPLPRAPDPTRPTHPTVEHNTCEPLHHPGGRGDCFGHSPAEQKLTAGMGVLRSTQSLQAEVDELRASLLVENGWRPSGVRVDAKRAPGGAAARTVCVTGGISFIGFAVVDRLLRHGYTVRLALETQGQPPVPSRLSLSLLCCVCWLPPDDVDTGRCCSRHASGRRGTCKTPRRRFRAWAFGIPRVNWRQDYHPPVNVRQSGA